MTSPTPADLDAILQERFGFSSFREGQREAISTLLGGTDLLVIQPTGHGERGTWSSACPDLRRGA